jgi:hypothetical protein
MYVFYCSSDQQVQELSQCQNRLIESYKANVSSHKLEIQQMKYEYEKKLADLEQHMKRTHQLEVDKIRAEATSNELHNKAKFESKYNDLDRFHSQTVHELEYHHNERVKELQQSVETAREDYANKKALVENQFKEVKSRVDKQNKDIEARKLAHQEALERQQTLHIADIAKRDRHIEELNTLLRVSNEAVEETAECMTVVQEVAALVILMHKHSRPRTTDDFNASELYSYLAENDSRAGDASGVSVRGGGSSRHQTQTMGEIIVSAAQMEAAYVASKVRFLETNYFGWVHM